jgi:hypothetical protein
MVRQVRLYKQVKNDLFSWGQLLTIVSDFIIACSTILAGFIGLSMALNTYPFMLTWSINAQIDLRYSPITANKTMMYSWIIHILSLVIAGTCLGIGVMARLLRQKRRIEFAFKLQRFVVISIGILDGAFGLILVVGTMYIVLVGDTINKCAENG